MKLEVKSIPEIFQNKVKEYGDRACVSYKKDGTYMDISWNDMNGMIRKIGVFLVSEGIEKGDRVSIFSGNRFEWWVTDQAILSIGAINVPVYSTNSAEEAEYVLDHSGSRICFADTEDNLGKVLKVKGKLPHLKAIVAFDEMSSKPSDIISFEDALKRGDAYNDNSVFDSRLGSIELEDLATIMYTSGTTGNPKGVMLSHGNIVSNINQVVFSDPKYIDQYTDDQVFLSFLPLSHSFERTCGYYMPVAIGATVAFAEDISKIVENLKEVRPTVFVSVPRIYEKVHAAILSGVAAAPPLKKAIFNWSMKVARKNLPYICKDCPKKGLFAFQYSLADKLVFSKIKAGLGLDRLKFASTGGASLSTSDINFFLGLDIPLYEGFGLTETSPVTNANRPDDVRPGSVGRAIPDTIIKLSDEGEILIKGPQVMQGYYKNREATDEVFTDDGFFKTGDIGSIDESGFLSITGRIKDILVTSGGKNISPQNIENSLKASKYIEQVAVIGDNRKYLSALVIPAFEELKKWANANGIIYGSNSQLIENDRVVKLYEGEVEDHTKQYARYEQIRKFRLLDAEWTQETEELTPTLKIKRRIVNEKYADQIEAMYPPD